MNRLRPTRLAALALLPLLALPACDALKEAMTASSNVVARAASQELTVDSLAAMIAVSNAPLRPDVMRTVAQLWVNYHLLGLAGAQRDSLNTIEVADQGMWSAIAQVRSRKFYDLVSRDWPMPDTSAFEAAYNRGELLAASHILLSKQPAGLVPTANDSIRREAERLAERATAANFARLARERSQDPGSKDRGGDYGVFPRGSMVAEFDAGILSVPPGGISAVVETEFGYHVIRRSTWAEAKAQFTEMYATTLAQAAESIYFEGVERAANVQVKSGAPKLVKAIAEDVDAYRDDRTVLATARSGNLTAGRLAHWLAAFPPQAQMRAQVLQAPDSALPAFVRNVMRSELLLRAADSAGVTLDSTEATGVRNAFRQGVVGTMRALELSAEQLDTAGTEIEARRALAAARVDAYLARLLRNEAPYFEIPEQLALVLRDRYESRVMTAGIDRALAEATRLRTVADSTRAAGTPAPQVPLPNPPE